MQWQGSWTIPTHGPPRRAAWITAGILLALLLPALSVDMPVARAVRGDQSVVPGDLRKAVNLTEAFGHLAGAVIILVGVWTLDRSNRKRLACPAAMIIATGIPIHLLKRLVCRTRPSALSEWPGSVWDTFGGLRVWQEVGALAAIDSRVQSFPSAHAGVAVALAWGLTSLYPQGRYYFAVLALLASLQRVVASAHYPSDVVAGAAIASIVAALWPRDSEASIPTAIHPDALE